MAKSYRKERMNETIKEALSELLFNHVKDPRVGFVTITAVEVSRDYESAKVYYTVMGDDEEKEESRQGLISAGSYLRKTIAGQLKLRNAPELRFVYDDTLDRSIRVEETIRDMKKNEGNPSSDADE